MNKLATENDHELVHWILKIMIQNSLMQLQII